MILGAIVMAVAPVSSFSATNEKDNDTIGITVGFLASAILIATLVASKSKKDLPVSP